MRLIILGEDAPDLPEMPEEVSQIWIPYPVQDDVLDWVLKSEVSVTIVACEPAGIEDSVLDMVADVIQAPEPRQFLADEAREGDVVLVSWDDSDAAYRTLTDLTARKITVQDMADSFRQLVIEDPLEELLKAITDRISADVLRTVRAEMNEKFHELAKTRRFRSGAFRE